MRAIARLALLLATTSLGAGCRTSYMLTGYDITQSGVVRAPTGPNGIGPFARPNHPTLEGRASFSMAGTHPFRRDQGMPGDFVPRGMGAVRLGIGVTSNVEFAFQAEYASGSWATPVAQDAFPTDARNLFMMQLGFESRLLMVGDERLGFGANVGLGIGVHQHTRSWRVAFTGIDPISSHPRPPMPPATAGTSTGTSASPRGQIGLFLAGTPVRALHVGGGVMAQSMATFFGRRTVVESCMTGTSTGSESCTGLGPSNTPALEAGAVGTAWVSLAATAGPVTFLGQLHANFVTSDNLYSVFPLGGDLGMRVTF